MNKKLKDALASDGDLLDLDELEDSIYPNGQGQEDLENGNVKKKKGRPFAKPSQVEIQVAEFDRQPGFSPFSIEGRGRRDRVKNTSLPIPDEILSRIKQESTNASACFIGLIKYALDNLDANDKGLFIKHIKTEL